MKQKIKELRVEIDGLAGLVRELRPIQLMGPPANHNSHEINKCYDSLIFGKAWLGKALGTLNVDSPYQNDGKRKTVEDIEPTADMVVNGVNPFPKDFNHIQKVDWLRETIKVMIETVLLIFGKVGYREIVGGALVDNIITHLSEARFWLGFELKRIREEK